MIKRKYIKRIDEAFMADPGTKPAPTKTPSPTKTPVRRGPSPIRRDKPSVKPKPMASAEDIYDRFITELKSAGGVIEFNLELLASKYKMDESQIVKGFAQYIYEASLEGNPGMPGEAEGDDQDKYLSGIENRAQSSMQSTQTRYGNKINQFMELVNQVKQLQAGKERELEELAEASIREMYGSILNGVKLDIKFPEEEEMKDEMEEVEMEPPAEQERITDPIIIKEIQKRKITNNITQGEAKNTKLILNMPFIADGLKDIFGDDDGATMISLLSDITNIAAFFDWAIPIDRQKGMWASKDGFAGTVSVDWEEDKVEEEETKSAEDIIASLETGDDILDNAADVEELFNEVNPVIKARGLDFAMLIHETVKGIYQLITSIGIPEDEAIAQVVIMNTDNLAGELEDLRYGPYIAEDLNTFISNFRESDEIDNLKEHFYGKLIALPAAEFLELIRLILMEDDSSIGKAQDLIDEVVEEIKEWEADGISSYEDDEEEDFEVDDYGRSSPSPVISDDESFKAMSNSELQNLIDDALDARDMEEVRRLASYLKESLRIKLIKKINESKYSHISSFNQFKKKVEISVNENISTAKQYFIKLKAEAAGFDSYKLTDAEKLRLESDPEWISIRSLIEQYNLPGYAVPFLKFNMEQGASINILTSILNMLTDQQLKSVIRELPRTVDEYAALKPESGDRPGYEILIDDLTSLKSRAIGRWIVKAFTNNAGTRDYRGITIPNVVPFNQKQAFQDADPELQMEIISAAAELANADPSGREVNGFKRKLSKFKSLEEIRDGLNNKIDGLGSDLSEIITKIENNDPGASVIWEDKDKLLSVFRSPETLGMVCASTSWCLLPSRYPGGHGMFYSYVNNNNNGSVQYVFFDYTKPTSDQMHLIGITVDTSGQVTHAHRKDDADIKSDMGSELVTYLDYFGIPKNDQAQIIAAIPSEAELIKDVTPFYKQVHGGDGSSLGTAAVDIIMRTEKRANIASFVGEDFRRDSTVDRLLATEIKNSNGAQAAREAILDRFKEKGCSNTEAARYFKILFEGSNLYTDKVIDSIIVGTRRREDGFVKIFRSMTNASASDRERYTRRSRGKTIEQLKVDSKKMIDNIQDSITYLEALKKSNKDE